MPERQVRSLGQEDPMEEGTARSNVLAWRVLRTEEPGGLRPWGHKEGPMDRGAWRAAAMGS